jgi:hypothetical protein
MMLGINRALLLMGVSKPDLIGVALRSAPAVLAMAGTNEGVQNSAGIGCMMGQVTYRGIYAD